MVRARRPVDHHADRRRGVPCGLDARGAVPGPGRGCRRERRVARLRVRGRSAGALRLGRSDLHLRHRADRDRTARAQALDPDDLQRRRVRNRRDAGRLDSASGERPRACCRAARSRLHGNRALRRQPAARDGGDLGIRVGARLRTADPLQRALDDPALRLDGFDRLDAGHPLATDAVSVRRARRAARRDLPVPALEPPGAQCSSPFADRPAHRARQPPPLPRALRARDCDRARGRNDALAVPARPRRLQDGQRPIRPSRWGWCPLEGRRATALGR